MKNTVTYLVALCVLSCIVLSWGGCTISKHQHVPYHIVLKNVGHATIWEVNIRFADFMLYPGVMSPRSGGIGSGSLKSYSFIFAPLASDVIATWRTEDGTFHKQAVPITPELTPQPGDNIVISFHDNGTVTVHRFAESDHAKAMKLEVE